ncbi:MAG: hypothetical protein ACKV2V_11675 [Blastocatellia bacterium]
MRREDQKKYDMFRTVREFGQEHASDFPADTLGGRLFARLYAAITNLENNDSQQITGRNDARASTTSKGNAREQLLEMLSSINRTARAMALDQPGLERHFTMPRRDNEKEFLATARSFLAQTEALEAQFIEQELPADFRQQLQSRIETFDQSLTRRNRARRSRSTARSSVNASFAETMDLVRRLDAVVRNKYLGNQDALNDWQSARRIERIGRGAAGESGGSEPETIEAKIEAKQE